MKNLINNDGSINPHDWFTFSEGKNKKKQLRVISTCSDGYGVWDAIDTIKNLENGKTTELKRYLFQQLNPIYEDVNNKRENIKKRIQKKKSRSRVAR